MLTAKQRREHDEDVEQQDRETLRGLIEQQVIRGLGEANGPHNVQVRMLWEDHYRVNVLIGNPTSPIRISNSYFIEADGDGRIVESNPRITSLQATHALP